MAFGFLEKILRRFLQIAGFDLIRTTETDLSKKKPPTVYRYPVEALYQKSLSHHKAPAFSCKLNLITTEFGFEFGPEQWHPFVKTLQQYHNNPDLSYDSSALRDFYSTWQPKNAKEVLLGENVGPKKLLETVPVGYVTPWSNKTIDTRIREANEYIASENNDAGFPDISAGEGFNHFGPVTQQKGEIEFMRLCRVYHSIKENGYRRNDSWDGDVHGYLLRKDSEFRFVVTGGHHRLAAASALGLERIPVRIDFQTIINPADADYWPQVIRRVWSKSEALAYFKKLFIADSCRWAKDYNLM